MGKTDKDAVKLFFNGSDRISYDALIGTLSKLYVILMNADTLHEPLFSVEKYPVSLNAELPETDPV